MLPYQPNCDSLPAPPARPAPLPGAVPVPVPVWVAGDFFDSVSLESFFATNGFAISFFSGSVSPCSFSVFSATGFKVGDGFEDALATTIFFGEGLGVGFGVGLGVGFGVVFAFAVGLGLGLHICRTIIEQHQGQVGVQSAPGQGSTFWFSLPLATQQPA